MPLYGDKEVAVHCEALGCLLCHLIVRICLACFLPWDKLDGSKTAVTVLACGGSSQHASKCKPWKLLLRG